MHKLWVEQYRPNNISDYVFENSEQKKTIVEMLNSGSIPHLLLSGPPGTGKTTLANIIIEKLGIDDVDVLRINASDENSVDTMRDTIKTFILSHALSSFKIIFLNEADYISLNGQAIMRVLMEEYADTARFILTCNYEHKIIPAIKSRCQQFDFKGADKTDIAEYIAKILIEQNIEFEIDTLFSLIDKTYPDIRKTINLLQQNIQNKKLTNIFSSTSTAYEKDLLTLINVGDWKKARSVLATSVGDDQYETVYRLLYDNIDKLSSFKNKTKHEEAYLTIAEHLYKHGFVSDPEINITALLIKLAKMVEM